MVQKRELEILKQLRKNSRKNMVDISRETAIPLSTVFDKLYAIEETYIKKFVALVDFSKLGYNLKTLVTVKAKKPEELKGFLKEHKNVNSVFRLKGECDFLIEGIFSSIKQMDSFIDKLREFSKEIKLYHVIDELMKEGFMG